VKWNLKIKRCVITWPLVANSMKPSAMELLKD